MIVKGIITSKKEIQISFDLSEMLRKAKTKRLSNISSSCFQRNSTDVLIKHKYAIFLFYVTLSLSAFQMATEELRRNMCTAVRNYYDS